jgi:hypothetical protein
MLIEIRRNLSGLRFARSTRKRTFPSLSQSRNYVVHAPSDLTLLIRIQIRSRRMMEERPQLPAMSLRNPFCVARRRPVKSGKGKNATRTNKNS